jgi:hypothetical protein
LGGRDENGAPFSSFLKKALVRFLEMPIFAVRFSASGSGFAESFAKFLQKGVARRSGSGKVGGVEGVDLR